MKSLAERQKDRAERPARNAAAEGRNMTQAEVEQAETLGAIAGKVTTDANASAAKKGRKGKNESEAAAAANGGETAGWTAPDENDPTA